MKRLSIYFYWNKKGWVGDYVPYYLKKINEYCDEKCIVVNEPLSAKGRKVLEKCCDVLLVRENIGFDSSAYKYALEYYGYEKIKQYDEVILHNFTHYGPIYPLAELFGEMNKRECDFWGINRHPEQEAYLGNGADTKIIEHIQSYFLVIRKKILQDPSFKKYWDTLKTATNYNEAIIFHELRFTRFFESKGFISSTFMSFEKYHDNKLNSSILQPDKQHIRDRNPLVKRKIFFLDNNQWTHFIGHTAREVLDHIDKNTDYDVNMIWQDLLKTQKMSVLRNNLHLNYYLPTEDNDYKIKNKVALVLFVYYEDLLDYCAKYASSMPKGCDIYIISSKEELLKEYKKILTKKGYNIICRKAENRGRDVSAYLVTCADVYENYDYICCMHDKKTKQLTFPLQGEEFSYHCFENNLASPGFVNNVIKTFEENPKLGMLVPPTIHFRPFFGTLGNEQGVNAAGLREVYQKLNLTIPFDDHPVAPFGSMFWIKGVAFKSILNHKWKPSDFPTEPLGNDGTISHAVERIYPMAVQNDGYYVGWLATQYYANVYLDNLVYEVQQCGGFAKENLNKKGLKLQYWRYKLLSKITFGKMRKHYKTKKQEVKRMLKEI